MSGEGGKRKERKRERDRKEGKTSAKGQYKGRTESEGGAMTDTGKEGFTEGG